MTKPIMAVIATVCIAVLSSGAARAQAGADLETSADASAIDSTKSAQNIVQIAESDPALSTLVTALVDAGLVKTLEGAGPFTVFAPTNKAFAKLPTALLDYLIANPAILRQVLLYHVAAGSGSLDTSPLKTVQGEKLFATFHFGTSGLSLEINNSWVSVKPIKASNGVIYLIDSVLLPQFR